MNWGELRSHAERGVAVGSHGVTHAHLTQLTDNELQREVVDSKARVEDELGRPCPDFAYPYGEYDARVRKQVEAADTACVCTSRPARDMYAWPRLDLYRRHTPFRTLVRALRSSAVSLWPV